MDVQLLQIESANARIAYIARNQELLRRRILRLGSIY